MWNVYEYITITHGIVYACAAAASGPSIVCIQYRLVHVHCHGRDPTIMEAYYTLEATNSHLYMTNIQDHYNHMHLKTTEAL